MTIFVTSRKCYKPGATWAGRKDMQLAEKQELVRLLNVYQAELLNQNWKNTEYFVHGVKAQYEHARIISTKLAAEIGREMKPYWDL